MACNLAGGFGLKSNKEVFEFIAMKHGVVPLLAVNNVDSVFSILWSGRKPGPFSSGATSCCATHGYGNGM